MPLKAAREVSLDERFGENERIAFIASVVSLNEEALEVVVSCNRNAKVLCSSIEQFNCFKEKEIVRVIGVPFFKGEDLYIQAEAVQAFDASLEDLKKVQEIEKKGV